MAKRKLLNVRTHLEHIALILDELSKIKTFPILDEEIQKAKFFNTKILAKHAATNTRKDIYIPKN